MFNDFITDFRQVRFFIYIFVVKIGSHENEDDLLFKITYKYIV